MYLFCVVSHVGDSAFYLFIRFYLNIYQPITALVIAVIACLMSVCVKFNFAPLVWSNFLFGERQCVRLCHSATYPAPDGQDLVWSSTVLQYTYHTMHTYTTPTPTPF